MHEDDDPALRFYGYEQTFLYASWLNLVLPLGGDKEVIKKVLQEVKGGSFLRLLFPTHHHEIIKFLGTSIWTRHPVGFVQIPDHLSVAHPLLGTNGSGQ